MKVNKKKKAAVKPDTETEKKSTSSSAPSQSVSKELQSLVASLNKKFGNNAISIGVPNDTAYTLERIPTGSLSLDIALGGGIPLGRYIQIAGAYSSTKTTQTVHIIREAQKMGLTCAFFDIEGTSDEEYFRKCGVDYDSLIYSRPDGSEEAFEMMLRLQKSGEVHLGVIDSLAALSPNKEQDSTMDETVRMGIPQQLLGEFFRKYQANNNRLNREGKRAFTLICINQLREKIGCFNYNASVLLADGSTEMIGKIVNFKMPVEVVTFNETTQTFETARVTNWFNHGRSEEDFRRLIFDKPYGNGKSSFRCTPDHKILTPNGYVCAKDMKPGDEAIQIFPYTDLSDVQKEVLFGSMLGDGCIRKQKGNSYTFRLMHCKEQEEYCRWKARFFSCTFHEPRDFDEAVSFDTRASRAYKEFYDEFYEFDRKCMVPDEFELTPLEVAIWFQDDGYLTGNPKEPKAVEFSTHRFDIDSVYRLSKALHRFGVENNIREVRQNQYVIYCTVAGTECLIRRIGKYIHPTMIYKVPEYLRNRCSSHIHMVVPKVIQTPTNHVRYATLLSNEVADMSNLTMSKFDIEVEGNHNYIVDGIIVHNSYGDVSYAPGGKAKDFAMSVDIRLRRGDWITEGTGEEREVVGQVVKFKIEKNKTFRRMMAGEFDFYLTSENSADVAELHNDNFKEMIVLAVEFGVIDRKGAWFTYDEEHRYQGINSVIEAFRADEVLAEEVREKTMSLALRKND